MESNHYVLHYQTSFIVTSEILNSVGLELKREVWNWVKRKETKGVGERWKSHTSFKCFWKVPLTTNRLETGRDLFERGKLKAIKIGVRQSLLQTTRCLQEEQNLWGMRYQEQTPANTILTEIGITERDAERCAIFNIRIRYHLNTIWDDFKPTVPNIVKALFRDARFRFLSGDNLFDLQSESRALSSKTDGEQFEAYLLSPARTRPLILAITSPDDPPYISQSLSQFAEGLTGKALVFNVARCDDAYQIVAQAVKNASCDQHRANIGSLWLFHPYVIEEKRLIGEEYPLLNLSWDPRPIEGRERRLIPALLEHLHRRHPVFEEGAVLFADVQTALEEAITQKEYDEKALQEQERQARLEYERKQQIAESQQATAQSHAEAEEARRNLAEVEQKLSDNTAKLQEAYQARDAAQASEEAFYNEFEKLELENKELKKDCERWKREWETSQSQILHLQTKNAKTTLEDTIKLLERFDAAKRSLSAQVETLKNLLNDRLILTDKAMKSLDDPPNGFTFSKAAKFLSVLYTVLYPSYKENIGTRRDLYVQERKCGLEYSANENALTMTNRELRSNRTVNYNGKSYVCEEHLKMSPDWRVYFTYSSFEDKIIVCSMGKHLDTFGTKRKGL